MSFRDILGQDNAVSFLARLASGDRLAHAYIFVGPSGVGKRTAALNFAKAINCAGTPDERPCDACVSCKKIDSGNHPDVFILKPDKADAPIKIDSIRSLTRSAYLKAYEARRKVFIIDNASSMTDEAQNALLKTLEEPPPDCTIILISESMNGLLTTIQSRAQPVRFFSLSVEAAKEILTRYHDVGEIEAGILSSITGGSVGRSLELLKGDFFDKRSKALNAISDGTFFDADFDRASKADIRLYLDIMLTYYRDMMVAKSVKNNAAFINIDKSQAIISSSKRMKAEDIDDIIKQIILTNSYLDSNANTKLAVAALGLNLTAR